MAGATSWAWMAGGAEVRSLRWKLVLMALVVVFIPVYFLNRYAISFFDHYTRTDFEANLRHYAFVVGEHYKLGSMCAAAGGNQLLSAEQQAEFYERIGNEIGAEISIVDRTGKLVFDSGSRGGWVGAIEQRPEVKAALKGGYSARSRLSGDRRYMYYYIARPIKDDKHNMLGVVYIVAHTDPIVQAIRRMVVNQRLATWSALLYAGLAALFLALTITRRLRRLTRETGDFAAGGKALGSVPRGGDEIAVLGRAIHKMADDIEARNCYNREFVRTTLHELKTPLTAIRSVADVLESMAQRDDRQSAAERERFVAKINHQVDRLMRLVGDLRELTRVDVGLVHAERVEVDYCEFIGSVLDALGDTFGTQHAELEVVLPNEDLRVNLVPWRIEQVLANLLSNAYRYTPVDGRVVVRVERSRDSVITMVEDNGCGIAPSNSGRVFDRFFTTERNRYAADFGSGLGLAIVAGIIRGHHGKVRLESELGRGSCFVFELPLARM